MTVVQRVSRTRSRPDSLRAAEGNPCRDGCNVFYGRAGDTALPDVSRR